MAEFWETIDGISNLSVVWIAFALLSLPVIGHAAAWWGRRRGKST